MSVTLFASGLVISDTQATHLDDFCLALWLNKYRDAHNGAAPPGWPAQSGHIALAEWFIFELAKNRVLRWEHEQDVEQLPTPEW